jgi:surfactin synthase thioesterase subunit
VDDIERVTAAVNAYTQTVGIYPESLKRQLRDTLPLFGAQRLTSLGYACHVAKAMRQDAIEPVRRMCKWIIDEVYSRFNGTPKGVLEHPDLMQLSISTLRTDFAVCETYTYTSNAPIDCSISAFGGLQDHEVSREQLEAWRDRSRASFSLCMFPGDHFFLDTAEPLLLKTIARKLQQSVRMFV